MVKTEKSLYIKILLWAYNRQATGFTEKELFNNFKMDGNGELISWYLRVFRNRTDSSTPIIDHFLTKADVNYWCLTSEGMSVAIDYIDLKEARESSKSAMFIAISSLIIAIIVGVVQILVQIYYVGK